MYTPLGFNFGLQQLQQLYISQLRGVSQEQVYSAVLGYQQGLYQDYIDNSQLDGSVTYQRFMQQGYSSSFASAGAALDRGSYQLDLADDGQLNGSFYYSLYTLANSPLGQYLGQSNLSTGLGQLGQGQSYWQA